MHRLHRQIQKERSFIIRIISILFQEIHRHIPVDVGGIRVIDESRFSAVSKVKASIPRVTGSNPVTVRSIVPKIRLFAQVISKETVEASIGRSVLLVEEAQ